MKKKELSDISQRIGDVWSNRSKLQNLRLRWWHSKHIIQHVNEIVCGERLESFSAGITKRAKEIAGGQVLSRGISVGCGNGQKEMVLIQQGVVGHFRLYEFSESRIAQGKQLAQRLSLDDKVTFYQGNAFELETKAESFDLVHWNNSLHHMLDVDEAVRWSQRLLRKGGLFYMDDFIGPSRFQWTDRMLEIANRVRQALPEKYLVKPRKIKKAQSIREKISSMLRKIYSSDRKSLIQAAVRPTIQNMIDMDPSEAADSGRILETVKKYFPSAEITLTGGTVYHLGLNDIIYNFDEDRDKHLLDLLLIIDDLASALGENHYAAALAVKQ